MRGFGSMSSHELRAAPSVSHGSSQSEQAADKQQISAQVRFKYRFVKSRKPAAGPGPVSLLRNKPPVDYLSCSSSCQHLIYHQVLAPGSKAVPCSKHAPERCPSVFCGRLDWFNEYQSSIRSVKGMWIMTQ